ncbi:MAG: shikimate dehydrogenase [Myxococcales bacterium]|nr:shikimate dehydrogenase [Myxococcales bacterium]
MSPAPDTSLCGILLHPAGHTRSPAMHRAAYALLGIDADYRVFDVRPEGLAAKLRELRGVGARQLSISLPHKETILPLLDGVDETASRIRAVNTVVRKADALWGSNTDWLGAVQALEHATVLQGRRAVVLGAGGTARSLVYGLLRRGARVTLLNRSPERARALAEDLGAEASGRLPELADIPHDVLVNTTSVGLGSEDTPVNAEWIDPGAVVMDAVYEPKQTRLLRDAASRGAHCVPGKWMLVHQAVAQLAAWAGEEWEDGTRARVTNAMADAFDAAGA